MITSNMPTVDEIADRRAPIPAISEDMKTTAQETLRAIVADPASAPIPDSWGMTCAMMQKSEALSALAANADALWAYIQRLCALDHFEIATAITLAAVSTNSQLYKDPFWLQLCRSPLGAMLAGESAAPTSSEIERSTQ